MKISEIIGILFVGVLCATVGVFVLNAVGLTNYSIFGPRYENVRREVYEQTKSFRDGSRRDFDNMYMAYTEAKDPAEKAAILSVMRSRAAGVDMNMLSPQARSLLGGF